MESIVNETTLICNEKNFTLPYDALPNKISEYRYNYLYQDKKAIVDKYYMKESSTGSFIIYAAKKDVPQNDVDIIIHNLVLRRGNNVIIHSQS